MGSLQSTIIQRVVTTGKDCQQAWLLTQIGAGWLRLDIHGTLSGHASFLLTSGTPGLPGQWSLPAQALKLFKDPVSKMSNFILFASIWDITKHF